MKHAQPKSPQKHTLEQLIHIGPTGEPELDRIPITRSHKLTPPFKPSLTLNPITDHSISPLEELRSLPLHDRILITGLATLKCQGRSLNEILKLTNTEGDYVTSSIIEHNHYLIDRLSAWLSDHLF